MARRENVGESSAQLSTHCEGKNGERVRLFVRCAGAGAAARRCRLPGARFRFHTLRCERTRLEASLP
jgi:hypothetical protein